MEVVDGLVRQSYHQVVRSYHLHAGAAPHTEHSAWMNGCMNAWMHECTNAWMDPCMHAFVCACIKGCKNKRKKLKITKLMERCVNG